MTTVLRGIALPQPKILAMPIRPELRDTPGFHNLQTYYPGLSLVCATRSLPCDDIWLDHKERVIAAVPKGTAHASGPCELTLEANTQESGQGVRITQGFRKITHLLDPVRWLQGKYSLPRNNALPWHSDTWGSAWSKLQDPMNQAYVEALACYALGKLAENDYTPHFHAFYGAFCAQADTYAYNITDSYVSYRHCRWFWTSQEKNMFRIGLEEPVPEDIRQALLTPPEDIDSSDDESATENSQTSDDEIETLSAPSSVKSGRMGSLASAEDADFGKASDSEGGSESDSDDNSEESEELTIFAEIKNFHVMVLFTEASEGTMDDLLDDYEAVGAKPGSPEWETMWKAWIFQIIAALSIAQSILGFAHNDLHSNNIVWVQTDKKYLYYSTRDGQHWALPTFGRIFRIIDFGRAIFHIHQKVIFSDDFRAGNDAAEQFNFGELYDSDNGPEVLPNASFDLSRFAVSIFESLFPQTPAIKDHGAILSSEPGLTIRETVSDLYNLVWSWLLCDDGRNVLMEPDGKERYPDFDLYKVIAAHVHNAVPQDQIRKPVFDMFRVGRSAVPEGAKVYSLFC